MLIKHYFLCGKTLSETKSKLDKYYSDSAPSLCGRRFESNEEVEWGTEGYFGGFDKSYT